MADHTRDEWISKRAYALWEEQGRPQGRDRDHWLQALAEREALERTRATSDGHEVLVRFCRNPAPPAAPRSGDPSQEAAGCR
ncbi:DUF2934 domain-containing protein [Rhizobium binxianense]